MWFNPGGNEMSEEEWASPFVRCLGILLSGDTIDVLDFHGEPIRDDTFLLLINAHYEPIAFLLPGQVDLEWQLILDTSEESGFVTEPKKFASGEDVPLTDRAACLLQLTRGAQAQARQESYKKRRFDVPRKQLSSLARPDGRGRPSPHNHPTQPSNATTTSYFFSFFSDFSGFSGAASAPSPSASCLPFLMTSGSAGAAAASPATASAVGTSSSLMLMMWATG